MISSVLPLFADDRSDLRRPAVLPDILFADVNRDPLVSVAFLFELRFCFAAAPPFESSISSTDASSLSFFGPDSSHNLPFFCVTH